MAPMLFKIGDILINQRLISFYYKQILGVLFFSRLGEIKAASDEGLPVDYDDFVMGYGMRIVDQHRNPGVSKKGCCRKFLGSLTFSKTANTLTPRL